MSPNLEVSTGGQIGAVGVASAGFKKYGIWVKKYGIPVALYTDYEKRARKSNCRGWCR
jgi:hypothetical protein